MTPDTVKGKSFQRKKIGKKKCFICFEISVMICSLVNKKFPAPPNYLTNQTQDFSV